MAVAPSGPTTINLNPANSPTTKEEALKTVRMNGVFLDSNFAPFVPTDEENGLSVVAPPQLFIGLKNGKPFYEGLIATLEKKDAVKFEVNVPDGKNRLATREEIATVRKLVLTELGRSYHTNDAEPVQFGSTPGMLAASRLFGLDYKPEGVTAALLEKAEPNDGPLSQFAASNFIQTHTDNDKVVDRTFFLSLPEDAYRLAMQITINIDTRRAIPQVTLSTDEFTREIQSRPATIAEAQVLVKKVKEYVVTAEAELANRIHGAFMNQAIIDDAKATLQILNQYVANQIHGADVIEAKKTNSKF